MSDIFISYAREDLEAARRLAAALEGQGWSVFWDRTIPAGKSWREVVGAALTDARCVLVLWSQHSVTSDFVLEEADRGLRRRVLIPAFIDSVEPPLGFGGIHAADLSTWDGTHEDAVFQQFLGDLAGLLGPAPVVPPRERPKAQAEARQKASEQRRQQAEAEAIRDTLKPSERKPGTQKGATEQPSTAPLERSRLAREYLESLPNKTQKLKVEAERHKVAEIERSREIQELTHFISSILDELVRSFRSEGAHIVFIDTPFPSNIFSPQPFQLKLYVDQADFWSLHFVDREIDKIGLMFVRMTKRENGRENLTNDSMSFVGSDQVSMHSR